MTIARACQPPTQGLCRRLVGRWWIAQCPTRRSARQHPRRRIRASVKRRAIGSSRQPAPSSEHHNDDPGHGDADTDDPLGLGGESLLDPQ